MRTEYLPPRGSRSKPSSLCIGIFDGMHWGHRRIMDDCVRWAREHGLEPCAVTMDPHPQKILKPRSGILLVNSLEHRLNAMSRRGLRRVWVIRFDRAFSRIRREVFVRDWLVKKFNARAVFVGSDFRFGYRGEGDIRYLSEMARKFGFKLKVISPVRKAGRVVSSTRLRKAIVSGRLELVKKLTGADLALLGKIIRGRGRGKTMGFPTLNLDLEHEALPPAGVYAVKVILSGRVMPGVLHLGPRPTFGDRAPSAEVHIPGRRLGDRYGQVAEVLVLKKLRNIRPFRNPEALQKQIRTDIQKSASPSIIHRFTSRASSSILTAHLGA